MRIGQMCRISAHPFSLRRLCLDMSGPAVDAFLPGAAPCRPCRMRRSKKMSCSSWKASSTRQSSQWTRASRPRVTSWPASPYPSPSTSSSPRSMHRVSDYRRAVQRTERRNSLQIVSGVSESYCSQIKKTVLNSPVYGQVRTQCIIQAAIGGTANMLPRQNGVPSSGIRHSQFDYPHLF